MIQEEELKRRKDLGEREQKSENDENDVLNHKSQQKKIKVVVCFFPFTFHNKVVPIFKMLKFQSPSWHSTVQHSMQYFTSISYVRIQLPAYFEIHFGLLEPPCCQLLGLMASLLYY